MTAGITQIDDYRWQDVYYDDDLATGNNDGTTEADAWQSITDMLAGVQAGQRVNMKATASPVSLGAAATFPAGDSSGAIWYRGYTTTPGDGGNWVGSANGTNNFVTASGPQIFSDISFTGTSVTAQTLSNTNPQATFYQCVISSDGAAEATNSAEGVFIECTITNSGTFSTAGYEGWQGNGIAIGCDFEADGIPCDLAMLDESEHILLFKCTALSNSAEARTVVEINLTFNESAYAVVLECSMYGGLAGIDIPDIQAIHEGSSVIANNAISDCDTGILMSEASSPEIGNISNNAVGNNTTADYSGFGDWEDRITDKIALSGDPFTDAANNDFTPDNTAGEGQVLRDGGTLGFIGGSSTELVTSAFDLGGTRQGSDDGGDPQSLTAGGGGGGGVVVVNFRKVR